MLNRSNRSKRLFLTLCPALVLFLLAGSHVFAQSGSVSNRNSGPVAAVVGQNPVQKSSPTAVESKGPTVLETAEDAADDDGGQEMSGAVPEGEAQLRVRISVPFKVRPTSSITLYPYPTRPPKIKLHAKIDEKPKNIRQQLLNLGYSQRSSGTRLFPTGGYRWQYVIRAACEKSHTHPPTNILTMYPWTFKMVPYVQEEAIRINAIESERRTRYISTLKEFEENGVDLENEALQKGLSPIEIPMMQGTRKLMSGSAVIAPGTWYVVATHKTPALKFYWQLPVSVSAGERSTVQLTQTNALVIEGAW